MCVLLHQLLLICPQERDFNTKKKVQFLYTDHNDFWCDQQEQFADGLSAIHTMKTWALLLQSLKTSNHKTSLLCNENTHHNNSRRSGQPSTFSVLGITLNGLNSSYRPVIQIYILIHWTLCFLFRNTKCKQEQIVYKPKMMKIFLKSSWRVSMSLHNTLVSRVGLF